MKHGFNITKQLSTWYDILEYSYPFREAAFLRDFPPCILGHEMRLVTKSH